VKRRIDVGGAPHEVFAHRDSKDVWVARGKYMGRRLEVSGRTELQALKAWRDATGVEIAKGASIATSQGGQVRSYRARETECRAMPYRSQLDKLRARYRSLWDAHQIIADQNVRQAQAGKLLTNDQLKTAQRAAEAVQGARDELLAAIGAASEASVVSEPA
jgi:hypothetical protein